MLKCGYYIDTRTFLFQIEILITLPLDILKEKKSKKSGKSGFHTSDMNDRPHISIISHYVVEFLKENPQVIVAVQVPV